MECVSDTDIENLTEHLFDLSCMYLAHHELESVLIIIIIIFSAEAREHSKAAVVQSQCISERRRALGKGRWKSPALRQRQDCVPASERW